MHYNATDVQNRTAKLDLTGIDLGAFAERPLDAPTLRCLQAMHDVEHHTICYLRDLLVTPAHRDPEITTFLTMWAFEEFWHGQAIGEILTRHGRSAGPTRTATTRASLGWRDRLRPVAMWVTSALGDDIVTVEMSWGVINEWTTQAAYGQLAARADHPVLTEVLQRIMRQEGRHISFYGAQATRRLADSSRARRITRRALRHLWSPVGTGILPATETAFMCNHLFGDAAGITALRRIDHKVDNLPGLHGLGLLASVPTRYPPTAPTGSATPSPPTRTATVPQPAVRAQRDTITLNVPGWRAGQGIRRSMVQGAVGADRR